MTEECSNKCSNTLGLYTDFERFKASLRREYNYKDGQENHLFFQIYFDIIQRISVPQQILYDFRLVDLTLNELDNCKLNLIKLFAKLLLPEISLNNNNTTNSAIYSIVITNIRNNFNQIKYLFPFFIEERSYLLFIIRLRMTTVVYSTFEKLIKKYVNITDAKFDVYGNLSDIKHGVLAFADNTVEKCFPSNSKPYTVINQTGFDRTALIENINLTEQSYTQKHELIEDQLGIRTYGIYSIYYFRLTRISYTDSKGTREEYVVKFDDNLLFLYEINDNFQTRISYFIRNYCLKMNSLHNSVVPYWDLRLLRSDLPSTDDPIDTSITIRQSPWITLTSDQQQQDFVDSDFIQVHFRELFNKHMFDCTEQDECLDNMNPPIRLFIRDTFYKNICDYINSVHNDECNRNPYFENIDEILNEIGLTLNENKTGIIDCLNYNEQRPFNINDGELKTFIEDQIDVTQPIYTWDVCISDYVNKRIFDYFWNKVIKVTCDYIVTDPLLASYDTTNLQLQSTTPNENFKGIISTVKLNDRILIQGQNESFQNGIYVVTKLDNPWILTRSTDFKTAPILKGKPIHIIHGNDIGSIWTLDQTVNNINTSSIHFNKVTDTRLFQKIINDIILNFNPGERFKEEIFLKCSQQTEYIITFECIQTALNQKIEQLNQTFELRWDSLTENQDINRDQSLKTYVRSKCIDHRYFIGSNENNMKSIVDECIQKHLSVINTIDTTLFDLIYDNEARDRSHKHNRIYPIDSFKKYVLFECYFINNEQTLTTTTETDIKILENCIQTKMNQIDNTYNELIKTIEKENTCFKQYIQPNFKFFTDYLEIKATSGQYLTKSDMNNFLNDEIYKFLYHSNIKFSQPVLAFYYFIFFLCLLFVSTLYLYYGCKNYSDFLSLTRTEMFALFCFVVSFILFGVPLNDYLSLKEKYKI